MFAIIALIFIINYVIASYFTEIIVQLLPVNESALSLEVATINTQRGILTIIDISLPHSNGLIPSNYKHFMPLFVLLSVDEM